MDWELIVRHEEYAPIGLDGGRSEVRLVPSGPGWPRHGVVLRLVMPLARPVVRVRLVQETADGTVAGRDLEPVVRAARQYVHEYPVEPVDGARGARYEVDWQVRRAEGEADESGSAQLLTRIHLVAPDPDHGDQVLASRMLSLAWCDPHDPPMLDLLLQQAVDGGTLPTPAAAALAELALVNRESVPACFACALRWELRLLSAADRAWEAAQHYGLNGIARLMTALNTTADGRTYRRPCDCRRQNPGTGGRLTETPEDELRRDLSAARARYLARREAFPAG
ncbi:hypothetical protein [Kitasatospora sp. NPDC085879]|uniref:hypothetical protein n=1 Tax=Kitasatospora sp. NPDC085879 TaxID=3154769 RepID=UPI0034224196